MTNSAAHCQIEQKSMGQVNELLKELAPDTSTATAIHNTLFVCYEQFRQEWIQSLEQPPS